MLPMDLLLCLFFRFIPVESFYSYGDVTITGEGLQMLTYAGTRD